MMSFQDMGKEILMFEVEKFVEYEWVNMMVVEAVQNFVDFAMGIMTVQKNVNVDFVGEKMITHDGKGKSVSFVHQLVVYSNCS